MYQNVNNKIYREPKIRILLPTVTIYGFSIGLKAARKFDYKY